MRWTLGIALASLVATGCATTSISTDYDPTNDFSGYTTFSWMEDGSDVNDPRLGGALVQRRIRAAIQTALEEKGLQFVESGQTDFMVGYHASLNDKVDVTTMNTYNGYWGGYGWGYPGYWGSSHTYTNEYTEGTLIVDIFDTGSKDLVWRGVGEGKVREVAEPEDRQERLTDGLRDLFDGFPPG